MEILADLDSLVVAIVIGILTSFIVQVIKSFDEPRAVKIQGLNILIGLVLGLVSMMFTGLGFTPSVILGLAGGVYSPGIYDMVTAAFSVGDSYDRKH